MMYRIVNIKFLFDFPDPKNLDSTLLKLCQLISLKCSFLKVARWFERKKFTAICCAIHRNVLYTGLLNFGYLPVAIN